MHRYAVQEAGNGHQILYIWITSRHNKFGVWPNLTVAVHLDMDIQWLEAGEELIDRGDTAGGGMLGTWPSLGKQGGPIYRGRRLSIAVLIYCPTEDDAAC